MNFFAMKPGYLNCFWMNCTLSVLLRAVAIMPSSFQAIITSEPDLVLELRLQIWELAGATNAPPLGVCALRLPQIKLEM